MALGRLVAGMAVICALAAPAFAEGLDAERFVPAVGAEGGFVNEHPAVPFHLGWSLGLFFNFADDQVVLRNNAGTDVGKAVDTGFTADLTAALGLFGFMEVGIGLPIHFIWEGDAVGTLAANGGVGDLRVVPKLALLRKGTLEQHFLLGIAVPVSLPTGNEEALRGAGGLTIGPMLMFAAHFGAVGIGADVGYRWRTEHPNLPYGDSVALGPWFSLKLGEAAILRLEMFAEKHVSTNMDGADFPLEVLGGIEYRVTDSLALHAGGSFGVTDGIGDPDFRIIGGIRFRQSPSSKDDDGGHPQDQGFRDSDGDGVLDKDDEEPYEPEDEDGFEDDDGAPEPDNDQDGIADNEDECPELKGDKEHDGCPAKTYVTIEDGKIVIFGKVQFRTGSNEIDKRSDPLLDQIAQALNANPDVKNIEIQGHTDNVGGPGINKQLSEDRAKSVKAALEKRDVDGDRLHPVGYGETRPLAPNKTKAGRAKNRRVEFVIGR